MKPKFITKKEWREIKSARACQLTGYPIHKDNDGRYYFWSMGPQPQWPADWSAKTPLKAAQRFLERFEKCNPSGDDCAVPKVQFQLSGKKVSPELP